VKCLHVMRARSGVTPLVPLIGYVVGVCGIISGFGRRTRVYVLHTDHVCTLRLYLSRRTCRIHTQVARQPRVRRWSPICSARATSPS
jgi:hypothetical protein